MPTDVIRVVMVTTGAILAIAARGSVISAAAGGEHLAPWIWPWFAATGAVLCLINAVFPRSRLLVLASGIGVQAFIFARVIATAANDAHGFLTPGRAMIGFPILAGIAFYHALIWRWMIWPQTEAWLPVRPSAPETSAS